MKNKKHNRRNRKHNRIIINNNINVVINIYNDCNKNDEKSNNKKSFESALHWIQVIIEFLSSIIKFVKELFL